MTKKEKAVKEHAWYLKNREKRIAQTCLYRKAHQEEYNQRARKRRKENLEKTKKYEREYTRRYRAEHPEVVAGVVRKFLSSHPRYHALWEKTHKQERHEQRVKWYEDNPGKNALYNRSYNAIKQKAMPPWVDRAVLVGFYEKAARKTKQTGIKHAVDHIWPIKGEGFVGLHVPWNLRVITKSANSAKSNRRPTMMEIARGG